jgi:D-alanine-D-alanine ligase
MKITVLFGGPSAEREVSLVSGRSVIEGLKAAGHDVFPSDISPSDLSALDHPADVIFPVLHGAFGESGELQEILESRNLPFVGSGSKASHLGMNKVATKRAWERAGLPTPGYTVLTRSTWKSFVSTSSVSRPVCASLGLPLVVKALDSGSSIDVFICHTNDEATAAIDNVLSRHDSVLVEQFIAGPELTVGLLEEKPLAPIRIVPHVEFFV